MKTLVIIFAFASLSACSSATPYFQNLAAGQTGCMPDDIGIQRFGGTIGAETFLATCADKKHMCTISRAMGAGGISSQSVNCVPAAASAYVVKAATPSPTPGAKQY